MLSLILAASLATTAADASQTAGTQPASSASKPDEHAARSDPLRVICRRQDKIGTNIKIRTCKTKAEWDKEQEQMERLMRDAGLAGAQNTGLQVSSGPH